MTPNKYRCETCKHLEKDFIDWGFDPYCHGFGNHIQGAKISLEIWEWIKRYGCASHSDFQSERDMVLDRLLKWRKEYMLLKPGFAEFLFQETRKIAELQQESKGEK